MFLNVFLAVFSIDIARTLHVYSLLVPGVIQKVNVILLVNNEPQKISSDI